MEQKLMNFEYVRKKEYDSDCVYDDVCNIDENIDQSYIGTYFQSIKHTQCFNTLRQFAMDYS